MGPMHGKPTDHARVEAAKPKLEHGLSVLDKHLGHSHGPHLVGDQFTLADICFMPYVEYLMNTPGKDLVLSHAHVAAWWKSVSERASWKTATQAPAAAK
jgi:glutathione S-transferase